VQQFAKAVTQPVEVPDVFGKFVFDTCILFFANYSTGHAFNTFVDMKKHSYSPVEEQADQDRSLIIIDDDRPFSERLSKEMALSGFNVQLANDIAGASRLIERVPPRFAIIDSRLADGDGLHLVPLLRQARQNARIVILKGYGNIASTVAAIKAGAVDYLPKPVGVDQVIAALLECREFLPPPPEHPMSADRVRWEHIQRIYEQCGRNISETARRLKMHRRTLQRILAKRAPPEINLADL